MAKTRRSVVVRSEEVCRARDAKGWSTEELARRAGYSVRTIQKIEAGEPVSPSTASDIAAALKVPYEVLVPSPGSERPNMFRAHLILECDVREAAQSERLQSFIDLIARFLPDPSAFRLRSLSLGGESLPLETSEENLVMLATSLRDIQDHALEAIAGTPAGRDYFRGQNSSGTEVVATLVRLVESIRELRIPVEPSAPQTGSPSPDPVEQQSDSAESAEGSRSDAGCEGTVAGANADATKPSPYPEYRVGTAGRIEWLKWRQEAEAYPSPEREKRLAYLDEIESQCVEEIEPLS